MNTLPLSYQTRHGLAENVRREEARILNRLVSLLIDLSLQAKQAHWNVRGSTFAQLHELFEELNQDMAEATDVLAERIVQLGGVAKGTLQAVAEATTLAPYPVHLVDSEEHLGRLADSLAKVSEELRRAADLVNDLGDAATNDICVEALRSVDKWLWKIEASLVAPEGQPILP